MRHPAAALWLTLLLVATAPILPAPATAQEEPNSCLQCHQAQSGRLGEPVARWRGSIHAANGIACHSCHGGDPTLMSMEAMSPAKGFLGVPEAEAIPGFCGRCHVGVEEDYRQSAHGQALGSGGPQCVTCHGNHAVKRAGPELINPEDCSRCHEYGRAETIKEAVATTDERLSALREDLIRLHRAGFATEDLKKSLFALRNRFHRLFHSVDVAKVRAETGDIRDQLGELRQQVEAMDQTLSRRKLGGAVVVGLLVLAGILAGLIRRSYHQEEDGS